MQTADIRGRWLDFFADRGHTVVPSASLVSDDPTLLFTVAGMVPFVPYLTGLVPAPYTRATSVQKCIRTNDIEEVGKTPRHGTFFQMNGNFSFGDYFKEEAIGFAWELLTTPENQGGYGFRESDLWVTIYLDDDEAFRYWRAIGVPENRIQRLGMESNYWSTGQPGPAGPCSEIFFDRGPAYGADGGPATDDDRYVEIWNLVFMQYLRGESTGKSDFQILGDLPKKNIDTGMGLERVAFLKQGVENMYEIDQVRPVLDRAAALSGRRYGANHDDDVRMRIVADHVRSSLMLMSDGVMPSNEGRGYILRRLLRRSVRAMRLLGVDSTSLPELLPASRDAMSSSYPEVQTDFGRISQAAYSEEETFLRTLASGSAVLDLAVAKTKTANKTELAGPTAFLLHDTYGFPIEITLEIAEEAGLSVNREAFDALMTKQRTMAKADAKSKKTHLADLGVYSPFRAEGETLFTGYDALQHESSVLGLIVDGVSVTSAVAGETAEVILAETALWAESGGQDADRGLIVGAGFELEVLDVQKPVKGLISHTVMVRSGEVGVDDHATSIVDPDWRRGARQAHSGTHVLHAALRQVLGPNAHQSGSYNKAGFFRLDFSWNQALSLATRSEIEEISNNAIRDNLPVTTRELPLAEAKALGAMALFGEKYGDRVRVVDIGGPWSRELCAGTHVTSSAEIGMINLTSEASVGSTNRRVEALVGLEAFRDLATERALVSQLTASLKTPREQLPERISDLVQNLKAAEKKIAAFESRALTERVPALVASQSRAGAVTVVAQNLGVLNSADDVRLLVTSTRERLGAAPAVVALAAIVADKPVVIVATNQAARDAGQKAGALAKQVAGILGGGGGGKDDLAQGGGTNVEAIAAALAAVIATVSH
ncbi:alanyl-tRNA synthetase [Cryobacterium roopkundense]|uniref:Alanine--tRNA ligase n=1 Tax=Cryobacterium roopkundense TaxID=1001240 RepID=A0A099JM44_9MICO|nr:alanine--tRNA ligase [Cryobacterium roopkundense]KGJ79190.1 alanyl-tRNA synthetase [Cryobacterium roopkundense]MBB5641383.1 alanyl-tRNA synthetase [Cryobacterium roopkundense]